MRTVEAIRSYAFPSAEVFNCLDDLSVTGMHMTKSSMPMMGGKMDIDYLSPNKTGINSTYRWTGKVLWWVLDFTVRVTSWVSGKQKSWETQGVARMIIYSWFKMDLRVEGDGPKSTAYLSISYKKANGFFKAILSAAFGGWYARWCLKNMLNDAESRLENQVTLTTGSG